MRNKTKLFLISALSLCTLTAGATAVMASANDDVVEVPAFTFEGTSIRLPKQNDTISGVRFAVQMSTADWDKYSADLAETWITISYGETVSEPVYTSESWYTVDGEGAYVAENFEAYQATVVLYEIPSDFFATNFKVQAYARFKGEEQAFASEVFTSKSMNEVAIEYAGTDAGKLEAVEAYLPSYTVAFEGIEATETVKYGKTVAEPNAPTKAGFVFKGWDFDFSQAITKDTTINALWWEEVDMTAQNFVDLDKSEATQSFATTAFGAVEKVTYGEYEVECAIDNEAGTVTLEQAITANLPNGESVVKVWTADKIYSVKITACTKLIDSEADWLTVYNDLTGYYKLSGDVEFKANLLNRQIGGVNQYGANFSGVLDGNGYKMYGSQYQQRLFHTLSGTVKNVTLITAKLDDWGGALGYAFTNTGLVENVKASITIGKTRFYNGIYSDNRRAGGFFVESYGDFKDCTVNVIVPADIGAGNITGTDVLGYPMGVEYLSVFCGWRLWEATGSTDLTNCLTFSNIEMYNTCNVPEFGKANLTVKEMNVGETWELPAGATSYTVTSGNATVNGNVVTATGAGTATIEAVYNGLAVAFTAKIVEWKSIATEADFQKIYDDLGGNYRLVDDITLTATGTNLRSIEFTGVLDGNGKTVTSTVTTKLFGKVSGTIKNMNVVTALDNWGGPFFAWELGSTGVIENVDMTITFKSALVHSQPDYWPAPLAGMVIWNQGKIKDCTVAATVVDDLVLTDAHGKAYEATNISAFYVGAYNGGSSSGTIENCTATSNKTIQFVLGQDKGTVTVVTE